MLIGFINDLQDYLIKLDPLKRLRRLPEYGEVYTNNLLKKIEKGDGIIYVAKIEGAPVGIIAGILDNWNKDDELEFTPSKPARVLELIVSEESRGKGIGASLMGIIEEHFKNKGCDIIRVEVFEPNKNTHAFYQKCGYEDRMIDLVKSLL